MQVVCTLSKRHVKLVSLSSCNCCCVIDESLMTLNDSRQIGVFHCWAVLMKNDLKDFTFNNSRPVSNLPQVMFLEKLALMSRLTWWTLKSSLEHSKLDFEATAAQTETTSGSSGCGETACFTSADVSAAFDTGDHGTSKRYQIYCGVL